MSTVPPPLTRLQSSPKSASSQADTTRTSVNPTAFHWKTSKLWSLTHEKSKISAKYLRRYCSSIGISRIDKINLKGGLLSRKLSGGVSLPERLRSKTTLWVSESLQRRQGAPSVFLNAGPSYGIGSDEPIRPTSSLYTGLPDDGDSIRLLSLEHNDKRDVITAEMVTVQLSHSPAYRAVSYEWGCPGAIGSVLPSIELNGHAVAVQVNLFEFLKRLKPYNDHLPLWIDALCINQSDESEKSRQVPLMGDIYHKAESVLVWLGKEGDGSGNLLRLINGRSALQLMDIRSMTMAKRSRLHISGRHGAPATDPWLIRQAKPTVERILRSDVAIKLLDRTYWSRAWVVQEIVLARKITLFCGEQCANFQDLEDLISGQPRFETSSLHHMRIHRLRRRDANNDGLHPRELGQETPPRDRKRENSSGWLPYLLETYPNVQCSVKHDKIYSLLGLIDFYEDGTHAVVPDYQITLVQLFFRAFNSFIRARNPKYAEILRRALSVDWADLLAANPTHDDERCSHSRDTTIWWDTSWAGKVTGYSKPTNLFSNHDQWQSSTDYIDRHKQPSWFECRLHWDSPESEGLTAATIEEGDLVLGLAGTSLAIILTKNGTRVAGVALMTGDSRLAGPASLDPVYDKVLRRGFLDDWAFSGDRYNTALPVRLCVHQFLQLLACAVPKWPSEQPYRPKIPQELLDRLEDAPES